MHHPHVEALNRIERAERATMRLAEALADLHEVCNIHHGIPGRQQHVESDLYNLAETLRHIRDARIEWEQR